MHNIIYAMKCKTFTNYKININIIRWKHYQISIHMYIILMKGSILLHMLNTSFKKCYIVMYKTCNAGNIGKVMELYLF